MIKLINSIPLSTLIIGSLLLGLAPFYPEPHIWEKLKMLANGELTKPLDIFDFLMHAALPTVLLVRLVNMAVASKKSDGDTSEN